MVSLVLLYDSSMRLPLSVLSILYMFVLVDYVGLSYQGRISMDLYCLRRTSSQTCHRQESSRATKIEIWVLQIWHHCICKILRGKSRKWWLPGCILLESALNMTRDGLQRIDRPPRTIVHARLVWRENGKRQIERLGFLKHFVMLKMCLCIKELPLTPAKIAIDSWIWAQNDLEDLCLQKVPLDPKFAKIINRALTAMWSPGKGGNRRLPGTITLGKVVLTSLAIHIGTSPKITANSLSEWLVDHPEYKIVDGCLLSCFVFSSYVAIILVHNRGDAIWWLILWPATRYNGILRLRFVQTSVKHDTHKISWLYRYTVHPYSPTHRYICIFWHEWVLFVSCLLVSQFIPSTPSHPNRFPPECQPVDAQDIDAKHCQSSWWRQRRSRPHCEGRGQECWG